MAIKQKQVRWPSPSCLKPFPFITPICKSSPIYPSARLPAARCAVLPNDHAMALVFSRVRCSDYLQIRQLSGSTVPEQIQSGKTKGAFYAAIPSTVRLTPTWQSHKTMIVRYVCISMSRVRIRTCTSTYVSVQVWTRETDDSLLPAAMACWNNRDACSTCSTGDEQNLWSMRWDPCVNWKACGQVELGSWQLGEISKSASSSSSLPPHETARPISFFLLYIKLIAKAWSDVSRLFVMPWSKLAQFGCTVCNWSVGFGARSFLQILPFWDFPQPTWRDPVSIFSTVLQKLQNSQ